MPAARTSSSSLDGPSDRVADPDAAGLDDVRVDAEAHLAFALPAVVENRPERVVVAEPGVRIVGRVRAAPDGAADADHCLAEP